MDTDPEHNGIVVVPDEAQGPFVPLDCGPLFAATRSSSAANESTEDGVETAAPSSGDRKE